MFTVNQVKRQWEERQANVFVAEEAINGKEVTKGLQVQLSVILGLLATPSSTERHLIELCRA